MSARLSGRDGGVLRWLECRLPPILPAEEDKIHCKSLSIKVQRKENKLVLPCREPTEVRPVMEEGSEKCASVRARERGRERRIDGF